MGSALLALLIGLAGSDLADSIIFRVDGQHWHLLLPPDDLEPTEGLPSSVDRQIRTFRSGDGLMLSIIIQNMHAPATMEGCLELFERRRIGHAGISAANETHGVSGDTGFQEYDYELGANRTTLHHNIFSCRVRGTYFIDVHASKLGYRPSDRAALKALVDGVKIID